MLAIALAAAAVGTYQIPAVAQGISPSPKPAAEPPAVATPPKTSAGTPASPEVSKIKSPPPKPPTAALVPAKVLFGKVKEPAAMATRSIGFYSRGCLAGAQPIALDGPAWQVMRLSRNRFWGHPNLIRLLEKLAKDAKAHDGWPGLLVGDMSQPRGGPMLTGHASHQVGLDADIWLTPMPNHKLTEKEREDLSATSMLGADKLSVNPKVWTAAHVALIRRAASYAEVERVLVHPAIKKALCDATAGAPAAERSWLHKVRPYWGHYYHMHVRIGCPKGSTGCRAQAAPPNDDGCGHELDTWFKMLTRPPAPPPKPPKKKPPPPKPVTLDQMPAACRLVLSSPAKKAAPPPTSPTAAKVK
jgi:penicillin-insensitive murein endopeptidase